MKYIHASTFKLATVSQSFQYHLNVWLC